MKNHSQFLKVLFPLSISLLMLAACFPLPANKTLTSQEVQQTQYALQTYVYATLTALPTQSLPLVNTPTPPPTTTTQPNQPTPSKTSITNNTPGTQTPASLLPVNVVIEGLGCLPLKTQEDLAIVLKVIDGDTIQVLVNGQTKIVRYIGIDAPQMPSGNNPGGRLAQDAYLLNKSLVDGKIIILVKDVSDADASGNLLRYVLTDNFFINYEFVKRGFAAAIAVPPDVTCRATFEAAQLAAMAKHIGVWLATPTNTPRPNNLPSLTPTFMKSDH